MGRESTPTRGDPQAAHRRAHPPLRVDGGRALQTCLDVGLRGDPRLDTLAAELVESQWPDGGWNCDRKAHVTHSSFNESWGQSSAWRGTA